MFKESELVDLVLLIEQEGIFPRIQGGGCNYIL